MSSLRLPSSSAESPHSNAWSRVYTPLVLVIVQSPSDVDLPYRTATPPERQELQRTLVHCPRRPSAAAAQDFTPASPRSGGGRANGHSTNGLLGSATGYYQPIMTTTFLNVDCKEELSVIEQLKIRFFVTVLQQMTRADAINALLSSVVGGSIQSRMRAKLAKMKIKHNAAGNAAHPVSAPALTSSAGECGTWVGILSQVVEWDNSLTQERSIEPKSSRRPNFFGLSPGSTFRSPRPDSGAATGGLDGLESAAAKLNDDGNLIQGHHVPSVGHVRSGFSSGPRNAIARPGAQDGPRRVQLRTWLARAGHDAECVQYGATRAAEQDKPVLCEDNYTRHGQPERDGTAPKAQIAPAGGALQGDIAGNGLRGGSGPYGGRSPILGGGSAIGKGGSAGNGEAKKDEEDFVPAVSNDMAGWLRTLRLHKYTPNVEGMTQGEMVVLGAQGVWQTGIGGTGLISTGSGSGLSSA
ncbi:hypothetical protein H4582DRAFT_2129934 [Lactarius indigo]|nr:hypothetical protein H4582DRAFT_2129934 [Lactarius indigo]